MKYRWMTVLLISVMSLGLAACGSIDETSTERKEAQQIEQSQTANREEAQAGSSAAEGADGNGQTTLESSNEGQSDAASEEQTLGTEGQEAFGAADTSADSDPDEQTRDAADIKVNNPEDAVKLLEAVFGTEDAETGYPYSFGYIDTFTVDGIEYYGFVWSWLVESDHLSRLTDVLVQTDGSAIYQGNYDGQDWEINSGNMLK